MRHARLTNSQEQELGGFLGVDLLILDDFCLDPTSGYRPGGGMLLKGWVPSS
jgi:hypothetical protein